MDSASLALYDQSTHETSLFFRSHHVRSLALSFSGMDPQIHGTRKRMFLSMLNADVPPRTNGMICAPESC
ncbi:hypothetical protein KOW79_014028 [Hemibagrus wyckioides]|uniref:Uncharacterized protein n=1 Tax=Hemibagrus wyckioides TaxID=337641 RepID=A0A9D3NKU7_9TELE|nr:hypothetical protein KOW79_014028 [Hemibagrus wyckioides]